MNSNVTVTDHADHQFHINPPLQRIVSLAPSNTEIVYALGAESVLVGVTEYCDYPPAATKKPTIGGYSTVDIERLRQLKPDCLLAGGIHLKNNIEELKSLGCPILILEANTISDMLKAVTIIGVCTGYINEAARLTQFLKQRVDQVISKTESIPISDKPKVYYLHECHTWKTFGADTIGDTLTELAGGYNIGRDFGEYYPYPTLDDIVNSNPDLIIVETGYGQNPNEPITLAMNEPALAGINARKYNRIYGLSSDLISRPGPRMVDGMEKLALLFHPELFNTSHALETLS